jgi:putative hydrolase of the HAD superfamily
VARHLIFDFFGTLVTYRDGVQANPIERARAELAGYGVDITCEALADRFSECFVALEREAANTLREYSMAQAARMLFDELAIPASPGRIARFVDLYLHDWTDGVAPLPRLRDWLEALPVSKSVLSNTHHEPMVAGLIERLGIGALFAGLTTSIGHGYRKPHPSIYEAHLNSLRVAARDAIFVGDNAQCDYFGPRAAGIEAYLVAARPVAGVPEHHRLAHLFQLGERLR